jgi:hypothetical protein
VEEVRRQYLEDWNGHEGVVVRVRRRIEAGSNAATEIHIESGPTVTRRETRSDLDVRLARHPRDRMISFDASASQSEAVTWQESFRGRL